MMRRNTVVALAAILFLGNSSTGSEPPWKKWCKPACGVPCCCPDDYCRKPPSWVPCRVKCWCPDDYCPKKLPPVPCRVPAGCADDYCAKKLPALLPPLWGPWYTCGPPAPCLCPWCEH